MTVSYLYNNENSYEYYRPIQFFALPSEIEEQIVSKP